MKSCKVYRSEKKAETYLYLADSMEFKDLPEELRERFGVPFLVIPLMLTKKRKLARVEVEKVITNLEEHGFYLQLPPKLPVEEEISRRFS